MAMCSPSTATITSALCVSPVANVNGGIVSSYETTWHTPGHARYTVKGLLFRASGRKTHVASHVDRDPELMESLQEGCMVISRMANISSHVHQRLLGNDLAGLPVSNLQHSRLVADFDQVFVQASSFQQPQCVFAESQPIPETQELSHFLEDFDLKALSVHGHCRCTTTQAGADHDD